MTLASQMSGQGSISGDTTRIIRAIADGLSCRHSGDPNMIHDCVVYHMQAHADMLTKRLCPSLDTAKQCLCTEPDTANTRLCPVLHFPDKSDLLSFSDLQDVILEIWGEL